MKRVAIVLLLAVVVLGGYKLVRDRFAQAALEELGETYAAETAVFLAKTWPRTPLPGEPVEGYALDWYERACKLGLEADEKVGEGVLDFSPENPAAQAAVDAWLETGKEIPAETLVGFARDRAMAWGAALALVDKGTRCAELGPRRSAVRSISMRGDSFTGEILSLLDVLDLASALDVSEGRHADALRRALVYARMGDDLARGGVLLETLFGTSIHERGGLLLERLLSSGALGEADLEAAAEALRAGIRDRLPEHLQAQGEWFWAQRLLADLEGGEVDFGEVTGNFPSSPLEHVWAWFGGGISRPEILAAWRKIREVRDRLEAAGAEGPAAYETALAAAHGWDDSEDLAWFGVYGTNSMPQARVFKQVRDLRTRDEALILACLALREIRRTGALPGSIEEIRPPEVRSSPDWGEWRIVAAKDGKPAALAYIVDGTVAREIHLK